MMADSPAERERLTAALVRDYSDEQLVVWIHALQDREEELEARVERLTAATRVGEDNIRSLWAALRMVRDAVEEVGPVGALPNVEHEGLEPEQVGECLAAAIAGMGARIPDPDDLRLVLDDLEERGSIYSGVRRAIARLRATVGVEP